MKKLIYTIAISSICLSSCGGSGGGDTPTPPPTPVNQKPTVPSLVYPTANLLCIVNTVNFQWNASTDPNGDAITYQIQVAKNSQFSPVTHTLNLSATSQSIALEKGVAYFWRVRATDSKSASSDYAASRQFYTEGLGITNHLPFSPELVKPILNSIEQGTTATLEWTASDVDSDPLTFDVFFGTSNPPTTKMGDNQSEKTLDVNITASSNYYWKVVVKDDKGGQTIGQIWNFKTD